MVDLGATSARNQSVPASAPPTCSPPKWYTFASVQRTFSGQVVGARVASQNSRLITYCWRTRIASAKFASTTSAMAPSSMPSVDHQPTHEADDEHADVDGEDARGQAVVVHESWVLEHSAQAAAAAGAAARGQRLDIVVLRSDLGDRHDATARLRPAGLASARSAALSTLPRLVLGSTGSGCTAVGVQ